MQAFQDLSSRCRQKALQPDQGDPSTSSKLDTNNDGKGFEEGLWYFGFWISNPSGRHAKMQQRRFPGHNNFVVLSGLG